MKIKIYEPDNRTGKELAEIRRWYKENYAPETLDDPSKHDDFINGLIADCITDAGYTAPIFINPGKIYLDLFWDRPALMIMDCYFYTVKNGNPMIVRFSGYFDQENRDREKPYVTEFTKTFTNPEL